MSTMSDLLEKIKDKDIKILDDTLIQLTGNASLLINHHGVIFETESSYPDIVSDDGSIFPINTYLGHDDILYENYICLSIGKLMAERDVTFVDKIRPSGFVSNSSDGLLAQLESEVIQFKEIFNSRLTSPKMRFYNTDGGITDSVKEGDCFVLEGAPVVTLNKYEVIKRIQLTPEIIRDMIESPTKGDTLFNQIGEEMKSLGCPHYTFEGPDGELSLKRYTSFRKNADLRAYGLKEKK